MKKETILALAKLLVIPVSLLVMYLTVVVIWKSLHLPEGQALAPIVEGYFNRYGLWVVLISAIIEGTLVLGNYFPGGIVIFLGVIAAGSNLFKVAEVVSVVSLAFFIGYTIDYWLGKYGWYKLFLKFGLKSALERAQAKVSKHVLSAIMLSYWEPNLASITATAAGVLKVPLLKFLFTSFIGIIFWNTLWGALVHVLGYSALNFIGLTYGLIAFSFWVAVILIKYFAFDRRKAQTTTS